VFFNSLPKKTKMPELKINGHTANYRISSRTPPGAPTVLCLHGSGADSIVWSAQLSRLRRNYSIIAPDLPGHGRSEGSALQSAAGYAEWLHTFVQALGLERFFLMGHSFGGAISQEYACAYHEHIAGLVLIGTGTRFQLSGTYLDLFQKGLDPENPAVRQQLPEQFCKAFAFLKDNSSPALHADLLAAGRFDSRAWIGSITAPALVMRGTNDCVTPPEMPAELAGMLPNAELSNIENAGHVVMLEARDAFNDRVSAFFENCR
jgi:pimeloyl-ACP methyl ester carboxylesterase